MYILNTYDISGTSETMVDFCSSFGLSEEVPYLSFKYRKIFGKRSPSCSVRLKVAFVTQEAVKRFEEELAKSRFEFRLLGTKPIDTLDTIS